MPQQSSDPTPRATRPLTPTHPAEPVVERAPSTSAVLRAIPGARMRAHLREMRAAVTRMDMERAAVTAPLPPGSRVTPPLGQPTPRAMPRFVIGEVVSHPRTRQIGRIGGPPRAWATALKWPVHWLRTVRGKLCWTAWYTETLQEELESIQ